MLPPPPPIASDPRFKELGRNVAPINERIEKMREEREAQPLVTAPKDGQYTWDVFYKGQEGFAEHIQVAFDDFEELMKARQVVNLALTAANAETLPRDKDNQRGGFAPKGAAQAGPRQPTPQAQPGVTPVCPIDGATMNFRKAGVSQNTGNPYPAFWSCSNYQTTGCRGRMNA